jgi:hypothetical protein
LTHFRVFAALAEGTPGPMTGLSLSAPRGLVSAIRHIGWWLDWHTRAKPMDGCRELDGAGERPG